MYYCTKREIINNIEDNLDIEKISDFDFLEEKIRKKEVKI